MIEISNIELGFAEIISLGFCIVASAIFVPMYFIGWARKNWKNASIEQKATFCVVVVSVSLILVGPAFDLFFQNLKLTDAEIIAKAAAIIADTHSAD